MSWWGERKLPYGMPTLSERRYAGGRRTHTERIRELVNNAQRLGLAYQSIAERGVAIHHPDPFERLRRDEVWLWLTPKCGLQKLKEGKTHGWSLHVAVYRAYAEDERDFMRWTTIDVIEANLKTILEGGRFDDALLRRPKARPTVPG